MTILAGAYRVAERAGRSRAAEWAMTSEKVPAATMERFGIVNRIVADADLLNEARAFAQKVAQGPTRAYAAHKALLRAWAVGGVSTADDAMFDIAMPLFETDDVQRGLKSAVDALKAGRPRPILDFKGRVKASAAGCGVMIACSSIGAPLSGWSKPAHSRKRPTRSMCPTRR